MHKRLQRRLQPALTASLAAISLLLMPFSTTPALAQSASIPSSISATSDESGRRIWVNDDAPASTPRPEAASSLRASARSPLVYWSVTEHRFKPVPTSGATMRAARSAASEVSTLLDGKVQSHQTLNRPFTSEEIDAAIDDAASRHHVDPSLVRSVIKVESNFNPNAVSPKGAMGLMQLMPSTARSLNVSNPFDPAQNVDAGVRHLRKLLDSYGGNVRLSLAAYNAGSGAVARSAGVPRFRETQDYVRRITNLYNARETGPFVIGNRMSSHAHPDPVLVQRDARGVLNISNTD